MNKKPNHKRLRLHAAIRSYKGGYGGMEGTVKVERGKAHGIIRNKMLSGETTLST